MAQLETLVPETGDIDICVNCAGEVDSGEAYPLLRECVRVATMVVTLVSGDAIKPKEPVRILELSEGGPSEEKMPQGLRVLLTDRITIDEKRLIDITAAAAMAARSVSAEQRVRLDCTKMDIT